MSKEPAILVSKLKKFILKHNFTHEIADAISSGELETVEVEENKRISSYAEEKKDGSYKKIYS